MYFIDTVPHFVSNLDAFRSFNGSTSAGTSCDSVDPQGNSTEFCITSFPQKVDFNNYIVVICDLIYFHARLCGAVAVHHSTKLYIILQNLLTYLILNPSQMFSYILQCGPLKGCRNLK